MIEVLDEVSECMKKQGCDHWNLLNTVVRSYCLRARSSQLSSRCDQCHPPFNLSYESFDGSQWLLIEPIIHVYRRPMTLMTAPLHCHSFISVKEFNVFLHLYHLRKQRTIIAFFSSAVSRES